MLGHLLAFRNGKNFHSCFAKFNLKQKPLSTKRKLRESFVDNIFPDIPVIPSRVVEGKNQGKGSAPYIFQSTEHSQFSPLVTSQLHAWILSSEARSL